MCGIGAISLRIGSPNIVTQALENINHAQATRGPDGAGTSTSETAGIGMVRLRVRADQDEPEPIWLGNDQAAAYNGEIYRFRGSMPSGGIGEVRALCSSMGQDIDGMYTMAKFDRESSDINIWRDPFGIKPLWSRKLKNGVAVASTIRGLKRAFGSDSPRYEAIQQFLAFGRPIDGGSFFEHISPVPRGTKATLHNGEFIWTDIVKPEPLTNCDPKHLREMLQDSLKRVVASNRTMGLAVSGGLDSTILAHQLAQMGIEDIRTVSVLVEGVEDGVANLSELKIMSPAVETWSHSTITVTPELFARGFEQAPQDLGEPTSLSSVPLYGALADAAKAAGIVVLQVGEGADELFMGYSSYRNLDKRQSDFAFRFMLPDSRLPYLKALYGNAIEDKCREVYNSIYPIEEGISPMEHLRCIELDHSLEPLLRRADQILMSRSIEGRTPFLHGNIPHLALGIDAEQHMFGTQSKPLLRAAFPELDQLDGPWRTKQPFRAPIARWLQTSLKNWVSSNVKSGIPELRSFGLQEKGINLVVRDAASGKTSAIHLALALTSLVYWSRLLAKEG